MEVMEGEMVGQLRSAVELVSTQTTFLFLLLQLNDALGALTAGVRQSQRVAFLGQVKIVEYQCEVVIPGLSPSPRLHLHQHPDLCPQPEDPV